jgi:hypothetical protein
MSEYRDLVKVAMQASSEEECEEATQLFERMLEDVNNESFSDFEEFRQMMFSYKEHMSANNNLSSLMTVNHLEQAWRE